MSLLTALPRRVRKAWVMSDLSVRQNARADGHKTPPQPRGETLSPTEMNIEGRYDDQRCALERGRERALYTHRLQGIEAGLGENARLIPVAVNATKLASHELRLKQFNPLWQQDLACITATKQERDRFKTDNLLTRDAHNPDPMLAIGVGSLALVSESALNALLFAKVLPGAFVEAALNAITLSAPNIALGLIAGFWGFRGCHDIRPAVRQLGAAVAALSLTAAVLWNLYVGQLRALAEQRAAANQALSPADWRTAAGNLILDPLAPFESGPALTLVLIGLFVVAIALWDGLDGFSDRVPSYSRVDRAYHRAVARAHARKARFFRALDHLTRRGIRRINRLHRAVHRNLRQAVAILGRAAGIIIRFNERLADHLWVHREATASYRSANRPARNEVDVPKRFDEPPLATAAHTLPAVDWLAMHRRLQEQSDAACRGVQSGTTELQAYRLSVMQTVEAELAAVMHAKVLLPPLLLTAASMETV